MLFKIPDYKGFRQLIFIKEVLKRDQKWVLYYQLNSQAGAIIY